MNDYSDDPVSKRQEKVYFRTYQRNIPSQMLQPYLDSRPVLTKYSILPIIDQRQQSSVPLIQQATYNISNTFNPGNDSGPWSGYASNVNHESELRNQIYALQHCGQATYVPSSDSSLYKVGWNNATKQQQPFPDLFQQQQFSPVNPNPHNDKIGYALFNNATRQQLKGLTNETK